MDLKRCDRCDALIEAHNNNLVRLLDREYDLCEKCFKKVQGWVQSQLGMGRMLAAERLQPQVDYTDSRSALFWPDVDPNIPLETVDSPPVKISSTDAKKDVHCCGSCNKK